MEHVSVPPWPARRALVSMIYPNAGPWLTITGLGWMTASAV
jgi:hypothetical protein